MESRPTAEGLKMLIMDDEDAILFAMGEYFALHGFDVDCAGELSEAQALLSQEVYQVVIADLRLSGVHGTEGLELLGLLKQRHPKTKVILLTAYGSREIELAAWRQGVSAFLQKPQPLPRIAQVVFALTGVDS